MIIALLNNYIRWIWQFLAHVTGLAALALCCLFVKRAKKEAREREKEKEKEACNCEKKRRGVSGMYRSAVLQYTYRKDRGLGWERWTVVKLSDRCLTTWIHRSFPFRITRSPPRTRIFASQNPIPRLHGVALVARWWRTRYAQFRDNDPRDGRSVSRRNWPEEGWRVQLLRFPPYARTAFVGTGCPHFLSFHNEIYFKCYRRPSFLPFHRLWRKRIKIDKKVIFKMIFYIYF